MPNNKSSANRKAISISAITLTGLATLATSAHATLPEPHAIYYGDVVVSNQPLQSADTQYSIIVKRNGIAITHFQMGDAPEGLSDKYVLRVPMDSVGTQNTGFARSGDTVEFFAATNTGEVWLASTTVGDRGSITQLKLGMVDIDGDGVDDAIDNCPLLINATQLDTDGDGAGDACDDFPSISTETKDSDSDGMGDNFETMHGFNPLNAADAGLDADNDGISNLDEFLAGTNPRDYVPPAENEDVPLPLWALVLLGAALTRLGIRKRT